MHKKATQFDNLINDFLTGEIEEEFFKDQIFQNEIFAQLDLDKVIQLGNTARDDADSGNWQMPLKLFRPLANRLSEKTESVNHQILCVVCADFLFIATEALKDVPNGELLNLASNIGELASSVAISAGDSHMAGILETRIGALYLLPYSGERDSSNYDVVIAQWLQREVRDRFNDAERIDMPKPIDAFGRAAEHFERALELNSTYSRGFVPKCLAECFIWQKRLGKKIDLERAEELLARAAAELSSDEEDLRLEIETMRGELGYSADVSGVLQEIDMSKQATSSSDRSELEDEIARIRALAVSEPSEAVGRIELVWPRTKEESVRNHLILLYRKALVRATKIHRRIAKPPRFRSKSKLFRREVERVKEEFKHEKPELGIARSQVALATVSNAYDAEEEGIELAQEAMSYIENEGDVSEIINVIVCGLRVDYGATAWHRKDYPKAAKRYLEAAGSCFDSAFYDMSRDALLRAYDAIYNADFPGEHELLLWISAYAPAIEGTDPTGEVAIRTRRIWNGLLAHLVERRTDDMQALVLAIQGAKSSAFSGLLGGHFAWNWRHDAEARRLIERHSELQKDLESQQDWELPNEEYLLSALDDRTRMEGENIQQRLFNIEANVDMLIRERLAKEIGRSDTYIYPIAPLENVLALLDDRTALLTAYIGRTTTDKLAIWSILITKSECSIGVFDGGGMPNDYMGLKVGEGLMDDFGLMIAHLREQLKIDAGEVLLREEEAGEKLRLLEDSFLRSLAPKLKELKDNGLDHLAICPHGSSHFLPWHLLESADSSAPLADDWIVTYVPSIANLQFASLPEAQTTSRLIAFGLSFSDDSPHPAAALPQVKKELESIQSVTDAEVYLDAEATASKFLELIASADQAHVATHGRHHVAAPAYQAMYLQPDEKSDGLVRSYEFLGLDLSGVDLVTLSACETSLGRVDISDNLRGIPSSLFLAGVKTIIGTLWEVDSEVSAKFFVAFYKELYSGKKKLDAFRSAQLTVRKKYPAYCHWGAFHYSGSW